jgi:hypothetical protein
MKAIISLCALILMGEVVAGRPHGMAYIKKKNRLQKQEQQHMSNSEKKAWNMGWEKDQEPFKPIKTNPRRDKTPSPPP